MRRALCGKKGRVESDLKWEIVQYSDAGLQEVCILENVWRETKDRLFRIHTTLVFMGVFPLDVIRHIQSFVDVWRAVDARLLKRECVGDIYHVELHKRKQ